MKRTITTVILILVLTSFHVKSQVVRSESLFDDGWKFFKGDIKGAEKPSFDDRSWREVDLPHDWSIEELPVQESGKTIGPFSIESPGARATGYTLGGTAWYRKTFSFNTKEKYSKTIIIFDGVYMNCEVWVNGKHAGTHPYGYTAFDFDISGFLNPDGRENVIAVRVKNEGRNSRWYSGSGIYRHVWLIRKQAINIPQNGAFISTENITPSEASIKLETVVSNSTGVNVTVSLSVRINGPDGSISKFNESQVKIIAPGNDEIFQTVTIQNPELWSVEDPNMYTAQIQVITNGILTDKVVIPFGIRVIHFDAQTGFTLNGKKVLLKGGCLHHDNGFLGSVTIDRAEERRVELMKAYGFNAIRTSHNPPSKQFLDACDRIGILVMDEAFDIWEHAKNPQDYHLYFKEWWQKDLESMIFRDRNHPSVIMWSIGNELNERADSVGYIITKRLAEETRRLDPTRPVTEAICGFWDHPGQEWSTTAPAFVLLDIGGYNYLSGQYEPDHELYPERIMVGTESFPGEAYDYWEQVEKNSWVIGDFVWTGMDYLGESRLGNAQLVDTSRRNRNFSRTSSLPTWFNAFCGDIDLCGFKKPQLLYRDVIWNNSKLEMVVHSPVPEEIREMISPWGWPDESPSWNWDGNEGKPLNVRVFSSYPSIRLVLNGKIIGEQTACDSCKLIFNFMVPYEPGVLKAVALENGIEVASKELRTTGPPSRIKLTADRTAIQADRNDLSYVKLEITDALGNPIPDATIPVRLFVSGAGEIAGSGNACPFDMESFNNPVCKTYKGQALAILRPLKDMQTGIITLAAEADGLTSGKIIIDVQ
jgi:beta-galactosidase